MAAGVYFIIMQKAEQSIQSLAWIGWHQTAMAMAAVGIVGILLAVVPTLVTNGSLLTPKRIDALAEAGLQKVYISIDAASCAVHDSNRGLSGLADAFAAPMSLCSATKFRVALPSR